MSYEPPALFVAWRDAESRRIFPVGRLLRLVKPRGYEFGYIEGARVAAAEAGFEPFVAFPKLEGIYRSDKLLPFFQNRVLSSSRPDYHEYVEVLALDARSVEPMTLLAASGGRRATDLIELFPDWTLVPTGDRRQTRLLVRGVQYVPRAEEHIVHLRPGDRLHLKVERDNPYNPRAVSLRTKVGHPIGYLPNYLADVVAGLVESKADVDVRVERVNLPPMPRHHRVLCTLTAPSAQIAGYRSPIFLPISPEATHIDDVAVRADIKTAAV